MTINGPSCACAAWSTNQGRAEAELGARHQARVWEPCGRGGAERGDGAGGLAGVIGTQNNGSAGSVIASARGGSLPRHRSSPDEYWCPLCGCGTDDAHHCGHAAAMDGVENVCGKCRPAKAGVYAPSLRSSTTRTRPGVALQHGQVAVQHIAVQPVQFFGTCPFDQAAHQVTAQPLASDEMADQNGKLGFAAAANDGGTGNGTHQGFAGGQGFGGDQRKFGLQIRLAQALRPSSVVVYV
ncbi:hypothetical protein FQR65_LT19798 [Abscondita terminalis]|nr:hypothetical protein FQR65_LT19798 [Abscondita terminalis]